eukprot:719254-Amphidinium_carterae.1
MLDRKHVPTSCCCPLLAGASSLSTCTTSHSYSKLRRSYMMRCYCVGHNQVTSCSTSLNLLALRFLLAQMSVEAQWEEQSSQGAATKLVAWDAGIGARPPSRAQAQWAHPS